MKENYLFFIFFSAILLFHVNFSHGQRFQGGMRAGLTASEVSGDNLSGPNKLGFYASAFTTAPITEFSKLMLEVMYIHKGSRSIPTERNEFYEYLFALQYAEVPITFQTDISPYTDLSFINQLVVKAGLSASFLVGYTETDMGTPVPSEEREDFFPAELNIILGFSFPISSSIDFNFGFSNSLTPIRPHAGGGKVWYNRGQYNTVWSFGLSFIIW